MKVEITLEELQQEILERLEKFNRATVSNFLMRKALDDPDEKETSLGVSKNEMIMLAGGRRPESKKEKFNRWLEENKIIWSKGEDSFFYYEVSHHRKA